MRIPLSLLLPGLAAAFLAGVVFSTSGLSPTGLAWLSGTASSPTLNSIPLNNAQVAFCPSTQCVSLPLSALDTGQQRIDVAMYSFTNDQLGNALLRAKARGVKVRVLLEKQQDSSQYSEHQKISDAAISVKLDSNPQLMHNKFAVIDSEFVITGSMNWTQNGVKENNENVVVIHSPELNTQFEKEFEKLWNEAS